LKILKKFVLNNTFYIILIDKHFLFSIVYNLKIRYRCHISVLQF